MKPWQNPEDWALDLESKRHCGIIGIALGLGAAATLAGTVISSNASQDAAHTQATASTHAADQQVELQRQILERLAPFISGGTDQLAGGYGHDINALYARAAGGPPSSLTQPFSLTGEQLAQTPGYQFSLDQGLKATQNSYAAQGLGSSGAAMKGAASFAQGLAGTTFQNQFQNYLNQQQQLYNLLYSGPIGTSLAALNPRTGLIGTGASAAAGQGQIGTQGQSNISNLLVGAANAGAAGTVGTANAISGGLGGLSSNALLGALLGNQNPQGLLASTAGEVGSIGVGGR